MWNDPSRITILVPKAFKKHCKTLYQFHHHIVSDASFDWYIPKSRGDREEVYLLPRNWREREDEKRRENGFDQGCDFSLTIITWAWSKPTPLYFYGLWRTKWALKCATASQPIYLHLCTCKISIIQYGENFHVHSVNSFNHSSHRSHIRFLSNYTCTEWCM